MLVVKGVQKNGDAVVLVEVFALGKVRANGARRVYALENDVEIFLVVGKISCG